MPKIMAQGKTFEVAEGTNLREALLEQDIDLYSNSAQIFNCHGHGLCGTCLVKVEGAVSEPTKLETTRMAFPPNSGHKDRRLACQVQVLGDVRVAKFEGHFGEGEELLWTPPQKVVLDGEIIGMTPIDVECIPGGLTIFVPQTEELQPIERQEGLPNLKIDLKT